MPPRRTLPQELVDKVIDELGNAYREPDLVKYSQYRIDAGEALHVCTLVSKNWTGRSRTHLFKEVKIRGDEDGLFLIPPQSLMPYIKKLKIQLHCKKYRLFPSPDLLAPFHAAPIACLELTGGVLAADARACLVEWIAEISATLQTVIFKSCSLSLSLILDTVLAHPGLKRLHLICCDFKPAKLDQPTIPLQGTQPADLELGVFSPYWGPDHDLTVAAVAQLPIQFHRLSFDHIQGRGTTRTTNDLIKANAGSLSSLTVYVLRGSKDQPTFSLEGCFNLSELNLDMERADSCIITTSVNVLLTLDPMQRGRLEWIKVTTNCIYQWLCNGSRVELAQAWRNLDAVLSELAKVAIDIRGKRLTFILVSTGEHKKECASLGRKLLPELLPRFYGLGSLRVDNGPSRLKLSAVDDCFCRHGSTCMEDDYGGVSRG